MKEQNHPNVIKIRNAHVHNLKHIDVDIPLNKIVGIAGVSGSGKSSLALGVLYAEGSRRYLDALSTYTRRRMTQAPRAQVDEVLHIPAALALHQRPGVPGIRSTFGTGSELLNTLRLIFSRLANHCCPNGHYLEPTLDVAAGKELCCPVCGTHFLAPSAEELSFNSQGACQTCGGTGFVSKVDEASLVPDESLTIDEGAVLPWKTLMWSLMTDVCREMGVRTDVPFQELTKEEKEIVYHGPAEKKHIFYKAKNTNQSGELDFTYFNAVYTVENALSKVKDEKGMKRVERFLKEDVCPDCGGTGYVASKKKISVSIPAGIDNGQSVRIREKGEPGVNGGPRGDLLVEVVVSRHPIFQRQDMHIFSTVPITFAQAALGADIRIKTVDGEVIYTVKPGTKTDTKVRLKGKGVPSLRNAQVRGDHYVTLVIQTPEHLSAEAKEALRKFDELTGNSLGAEKSEKAEEHEHKGKKKKGFMDKLKETFDD